MRVLPFSTKSIKIFYTPFKLIFKIYEIHLKKKKWSWNKEKEALFVTEVFMIWFEEQHSGMTWVWCRHLNPIQHLFYLVNRNLLVFILIFCRAGKKELILNKKFLFSSLEWKGHWIFCLTVRQQQCFVLLAATGCQITSGDYTHYELVHRTEKITLSIM